MTHHVCSRCWDGANTNSIQWNFSGTRWACQKFIKARGNHGFYFITTISSMYKVRRIHGS